MDSQTQSKQETADARGEHDSGAGKQYTAPELVTHGELRSITLAGSVGSGDSGNPNQDNMAAGTR